MAKEKIEKLLCLWVITNLNDKKLKILKFQPLAFENAILPIFQATQKLVKTVYALGSSFRKT